VTRRDRSIRHALDKLAMPERCAREASEALAGESYDDRQIGAALRCCVTCGKSYHFTEARRIPVCAGCKR
jgi:hypothetical protein